MKRKLAETVENCDFISTIPRDIQIELLRTLPKEAKLDLSSTSHYWRQLILDKSNANGLISERHYALERSQLTKPEVLHALLEPIKQTPLTYFTLSIDYKGLSELHFSHLMAALESHHLSNRLSGISLSRCRHFTGKWLTKLPDSLEKLDISYCVLNYGDLQKLPKYLHTLHLGKINTSTGNLPKIHLPAGIKHLHFAESSGLTEEMLIQLIAPLKGLNSLHIANSLVTDNFLKMLENKPLKALSLSHAYITDKGMASLSETLTFLSLGSCNKITDAALGTLSAPLATLELAHCLKLTSKVWEKIPRSITTLKSTDIAIDNQGIAALPKSLTSFTIIGNNTITDDGVKALSPTLKHITLSRCYKLSDKGRRLLQERGVHVESSNESQSSPNVSK